jgi:hypothetical protein
MTTKTTHSRNPVAKAVRKLRPTVKPSAKVYKRKSKKEEKGLTLEMLTWFPAINCTPGDRVMFTTNYLDIEAGESGTVLSNYLLHETKQQMIIQIDDNGLAVVRYNEDNYSPIAILNRKGA